MYLLKPSLRKLKTSKKKLQLKKKGLVGGGGAGWGGGGTHSYSVQVCYHGNPRGETRIREPWAFGSVGPREWKGRGDRLLSGLRETVFKTFR